MASKAKDVTGVIRTDGLRSEPYSDIPGDQRRRLLAPATDETGREWPAGTIYTPTAGGSDGTGGTRSVPNPKGSGLLTVHVIGQYADVTIHGVTEPGDVPFGTRARFRF